MNEAIFGLLGVLIGSALSWIQSWWTNKSATNKNAKYLAIRVVCILDKYLENCADVVKDDGLLDGQRTADGCLKPQVKAPGAPIFPEDIDWKSIDQELMYELLSFPSEVENGDRMISFATEIAAPPDYDEWFDERKYYYSQFGLHAHKISEQLCLKYKIKRKIYNDWDPVSDLQHELTATVENRQKRIKKQQEIVARVLGDR